MQQIVRGVKLPQFAHQGFHFGLRSPMLIILLLTFSFFVAVVVVTTLVRNVAAPVQYDPFAAFSDLFPGQQVEARQLEIVGFSCLVETGTVPADISERCSQDLPTGPFSYISVIIWDGVVSRYDVMLREHSLRLGDLVLLWGDPEISSTRSLVIVRWVNPGVIGTGRSYDGHVTHFQTLSHISFIRVVNR